MLSSWYSILISFLCPLSSPDERAVSAFLNYIMKNIVVPDLEILRSNLSIYKLLCEKWREWYTPSYSILKGLLSLTSESKPTTYVRLARLAGLQVVGVLLVNHIPIYESPTEKDDEMEITLASSSSSSSQSQKSRGEFSKLKMLELILSNLGYNSKDVYCACAEGMREHFNRHRTYF